MRLSSRDTSRYSNGGLIGDITKMSISPFKVDIDIMGCPAIDIGGAIPKFDVQEVAVSQAILTRSRRRMLVADHSKFRRSAPARIARLDEIDLFITDRTVDAKLQASCDVWETGIVIGSA